MGNSSSLLPGAGHTPNYGINESTSNGSNHGSSRSAHSEIREHWGVVTYCALTACIISMVTGMSLSYSSIIINELNSSDSKFPEWKILSDGKHAVLIGVSVLTHSIICYHYLLLFPPPPPRVLCLLVLYLEGSLHGLSLILLVVRQP